MKLFGGIMGNSVSLEEELINLRLTSKQMQRASKKCEKNEIAAVDKVKKVNMRNRSHCARRHTDEASPCLPLSISFLRPSNREIRRALEFTPKMPYEKKIK